MANNSMNDMNQRVSHLIKSGRFWDQKIKLMEEEKDVQGRDDCELQDFESPPIMVGGDVEALYPSMQHIPTAKIMFKAVMDTSVKFDNLDYDFMNIYIYLVLGRGEMIKHGLNCVPRKKDNKSKSRSLLAKCNRDLNSWVTTNGTYTDEEKKIMLALMVQISVLVMMSTCCYSFGGEIFQQVAGAGIGLRGSACAAKILMGFWDTGWCRLQHKLGLNVQLFFRYIDDLRIYLAPINKGWSWCTGGWKFDPETVDNRTSETRTREEIAKSLGDVLDFLSFTTETAEQFEQKYLPTLDVQFKVLADGRITYRHFYKPMINNLVLQNGTALSKGTIFSSLRQDLVRRLLNTSELEGFNQRLLVIEEYIQVLINSGHKYAFVKAIVLQAITKFEYMLYRSKLCEENIKYQPLYRARTYNEERRKILKYMKFALWYTDHDLDEPYRQGWKKFINKKSWQRKRSDKIRKNQWTQKDDRKITTSMFVPPSSSGILLSMLEQVEQDLAGDSTWTVKLVEKSGKPLRNMFLPKFPIKEGCLLLNECGACENNGLTCRQKGVVYSAVCEDCRLQDVTKEDVCDYTYVGETSRTFRTRVKEHMNALKYLNPKSFQLIHWFETHKDDAHCPEFKFKVMGQFKDALTRQLTEAINILDSGGLNRKTEFRINEVCRLEAKPPEKEVERERKARDIEKEEVEKNLNAFIEEIKLKHEALSGKLKTNTECNYRKRPQIQQQETIDQCLQRKSKRKKTEMDYSTPKEWRQREKEEDSPCSVLGITPIKPQFESPDIVPPSLLEDCDTDHTGSDKGRTFMSNELRGSRISPLKIEEESFENKSLALETSMLIVSSKLGGRIDLGQGGTESNVALDENYFIGDYRRERTKSLDELLGDMDINLLNDWSNDSFDRKHLNINELKSKSKVVLGVGAESSLLDQPATPGTPSARKRLYSPERKTPRGRPRKFSSSQMCSPALRLNLVSVEPDEGLKCKTGLKYSPPFEEEISRGRVAQGTHKPVHVMQSNTGLKNSPSCDVGISRGRVERDDNCASAVRKIITPQPPQTPKNGMSHSGLTFGRSAKSTPRRRRKLIVMNDRNQMKIPQLFPKELTIDKKNVDEN